MKRLCMIAILLVCICTLCGCGSKETETNDNSTINDYNQFRVQFKDTYNKYEYNELHIDAEEMANYFLSDLDTFEDEIEIFEGDGLYKKTLNKNGVEYRWTQFIDGGVEFAFVKSFSGEEYEKWNELVLNYMTSLDMEFETIVVSENSRGTEYAFRQIIEDVPVSTIQGPLPNMYIAHVGMFDGVEGVSMALWCPIETGRLIEVCETEDFLPLDVVENLILRYRTLDSKLEDSTVSVQINDVEIVYYVAREADAYVLKPVYEIDVTEKENNAYYEATYIVDVYTGYIEYREGDAYWL